MIKNYLAPMKKPFSPPVKLEGMSLEAFQQLIKDGHLLVREARLIPTTKVGDELSLASIFLSTLKLVKEFREKFFKEVKFKKAGRQLYYTEVQFSNRDFSDCRFDGLILTVVGGKIKDALFLEFKGKGGTLEGEQVSRYVKFLKSNFKVAKLVTISSQYVADPSQRPYQMKSLPKGFETYHMSWSHIKTMAHVLLFDNDDNVEDEDQVAILSETLHHLESDTIGLKGYHQMKAGWKAVSEALKTTSKPSAEHLEEAVQSWLEEQTDMAHILSQKLGVLVKTSSTKKDSALKKRLKNESATLAKEGVLDCQLEVRGAPSLIHIETNFARESVEMEIALEAPRDRGNKARISWLQKQLERCAKKNPEQYSQIESHLGIKTSVKFARNAERLPISQGHQIPDIIDMTKEIQSFRVSFVKPLGAKFRSAKGFVAAIEEMLLLFYEGVVQNSQSWSPPAPRIHSDSTQ